MIKCDFCNYECKQPNTFLRHVLFHHDSTLSKVQIYEYCLTKIYNITTQELSNIVQKYIDGYSLEYIDKNLNIKKTSLRPYLIVLGIKIRTQSESLKQDVTQKMLKQQWMDKYGVDSPSKLDWVKKKKIETSLKNNGYINNFCNPDIGKHARDKINHDKVWESNQKTLKDKYGVLNPAQITGVGDKISKSQINRMSKLTYEEKLKLTENARKAVKYTSLLENRIQSIINNISIEYYVHVFLCRYNFDFVFKNKKILEVNGDFWHANPKLYKEEDELLKGWFVKDIWLKDEKKKLAVEKIGYTVYCLWESDINSMSDQQIEEWIYDNIIN